MQIRGLMGSATFLLVDRYQITQIKYTCLALNTSGARLRTHLWGQQGKLLEVVFNWWCAAALTVAASACALSPVKPLTKLKACPAHLQGGCFVSLLWPCLYSEISALLYCFTMLAFRELWVVAVLISCHVVRYHVADNTCWFCYFIIKAFKYNTITGGF